MYLETEMSITNFFPQVLFYLGFTYYTLSFIKYIKNKRSNCNEYQINDINDVSLIGINNNNNNNSNNNIETNEEETEEEEEIQKQQTKQQSIIENMLSSKTLERALVLYYIFKIKGNYKIIYRIKNDSQNEFILEYNSFKEFENLKNIINDYLKIETLGNIIINEPSLDETLEPNTEIKIGKKEYKINSSHLMFISWLYNSGIYEYVTENDEIKMSILKEMNDEKLLRGNLFLRYQLLIL